MSHLSMAIVRHHLALLGGGLTLDFKGEAIACDLYDVGAW